MGILGKTAQHKIAQNRSTRTSALLAFADTTSARVLLVMAIAVLSILYIGLVNSSAAASFKLTDLRKQSVALENEYQKTQLQQTALRSLTATQDTSNDLQLVAAGTVQYVHADQAVALAGQ